MEYNTTIILDGGHGFNTPGKRSKDGTFRENEFNDSIVSRLAFGLSQEKIPYVLLAPEWNDVPLKERIEREHSIYSDSDSQTVLISIHADAWKTEEAKGYTVFMFEKTQNPVTKILAKSVHRHFEQGNPLLDRGIKGANFAILRETKSPAVLIEAGFMTNIRDRRYLMKEKYRNQITRSIIAGIKEFHMKAFYNIIEY